MRYIWGIYSRGYIIGNGTENGRCYVGFRNIASIVENNMQKNTEKRNGSWFSRN